MRLGGFEPPTNGLEGRRSSAELQARRGSVPPVIDALLRKIGAQRTFSAVERLRRPSLLR
jgi:hypothetical protein